MQRLSDLEKLEGFDFSLYDLNDPAIWSRMAQSHFKYIIHLAARTGVRPSRYDPLSYLQSNVEATTRVLEFAANQRIPVILASSSSVYGNATTLPLTEGLITDSPVSFYAATKQAVERIAAYYAHQHQVSITALRFFTVYGPWNRRDMAIWQFMEAIRTRTPIKLYNYGQMRRDFTYVDDILEGIIRLMLQQPQGYSCFNIGYGEAVQLRDVITELESLAGLSAICIEAPLQPGDVTDTWSDSSALFQVTGFKPQINLREGLKRTFEWYCKQQQQ
jgi:UDP-glucuronate 4-epimerase